MPSRITQFPERFTQLNEQVSEVVFVHYLSRDEIEPEELAYLDEIGHKEDYRICDMWIVLKDGRVLGFQPATPEYLREYMEYEQQLAFISSGLLVVSEMTEEAILYAIEECFAQAPQFPLEHFGYRMSNGEDDDEDVSV